MAPFNKRQIGYIQAVAGRRQHTTLTSGQIDNHISSANTPRVYWAEGSNETRETNKLKAVRNALGGNVVTPGTSADSKSLLVKTYQLDRAPLAFDSRSEHNNNTLTAADFTGLQGVWTGAGNYHELSVFNAPCATMASTTAAAGGITMTSSAVKQDSASKFDINHDQLSTTVRASPDGYLHSTDIKFRFTLPGHQSGSGDVSSLFPTAAQLGITNTNGSNGITIDQYNNWTKGLESTERSTSIQSLVNQYNMKHPMGQDHFEFRWIVWRNKRATFSRSGDDTDSYSNMDAIRDGFSLRNPGYDLFVGQTGRKRGFLGYCLNANLDQDNDVDATATEKYSGVNCSQSGSAFTDGGDLHPLTEDEFTVDDLLTMRLNRDDYVIMKDVRFFLGKEHGKSHFEDTLHWDWNDPIDTPNTNVLSSPTLNNKNFRWNMTLIGTSGGKNPVVLNECVRWTTKMTSG